MDKLIKVFDVILFLAVCGIFFSYTRGNMGYEEIVVTLLFVITLNSLND